MKKMLMLMLATGFVSLTANAEVGKDKNAPRCEQVLAQIQETLKKNRPQGETPGSNGPAVTAPASSAQ